MSIATIAGLRWEIRDETTDWNTVNACAGEDEYGLAGIDVAGKTVIDFGAHVGGVAVWMASRGANAIAVEPVPENVVAIKRNAALNGLSVTVVEAAAGESGGQTTLVYGFRGSPMEEAHGFIGNIVGFAGRWPHENCTHLVVPTVSWSDLPPCDIAKIDCEGGEWPLLQERGVLTVPLIVGEWHPIDGFGLEDLLRLLTPTHEVTLDGPINGPGNFRATLRA